MDAKIKGPLRPLLSDQTPRKQAVSIAGTVRATLNNKIYWEAFLLTFWSILQWNNLLRDTTILFWRKTSASIWYLKYLVSAKIDFVDIRNTHIHGCMHVYDLLTWVTNYYLILAQMWNYNVSMATFQWCQMVPRFENVTNHEYNLSPLMFIIANQMVYSWNLKIILHFVQNQTIISRLT